MVRTLRSTALFVLLAAMLSAAAAHAAPPILKLCTARKGGLYYAAGEIIAAAAEPAGVLVRVTETAGSLHNVEALSRRVCDAAIVQADAVLRYGREHWAKRLDLATPMLPLYHEYLYLICRRDSGILAVGDLAGDRKARLLVGEPGSGSTVTWAVLSGVAPQYAQVTTMQVGRQLALRTLMDGKADCLAYVAGVGTEFMKEADAAGDTLRLIGANDPDFEVTEETGLELYRFAALPDGTYPGLQKGPGEISTIVVQALFVVSERWAKKHPEAFQTIRDVVEDVRPAILKRAGQ